MNKCLFFDLELLGRYVISMVGNVGREMSDGVQSGKCLVLYFGRSNVKRMFMVNGRTVIIDGLIKIYAAGDKAHTSNTRRNKESDYRHRQEKCSL